MVKMMKIYGTDAVEYVEDKLGFVEGFTDSLVEVRVKTTKASDLRVASILYRLEGHDKVNITSGEHRSVQKCIDELADKVKVKISKDQDKYDARRKRERRKLQQEVEDELLEDEGSALKELEEELLQ